MRKWVEIMVEMARSGPDGVPRRVGGRRSHFRQSRAPWCESGVVAGNGPSERLQEAAGVENFSGCRIESLWCQDCQAGSGTSESVSYIEIFAREDHFSASAHSLPRARPPQQRRLFSPSSARMKLGGGSVGASR